MNPRERYREALLFGKPDKVPFSPGGGRESTRAAWHRQGLPEGQSPVSAMMEAIGFPQEPAGPRVSPGVSFVMVPTFEEKVLEHKDGHYVVRDWMGAVTEISDKYDYTYIRSARDFVTRKWHKFPVESRADWDEMKWRYDPAAPERLPEDFEVRCAQLRDRDYVATIHFNGPFWQLREWLGMEGLCVMMADDPEFVAEMCRFWADFVSRTMAPVLEHVELDAVGISEDMAYKAHSMISPAMVRTFLKPSYDQWASEIKGSGCPIIDMDSDGYIGELIPIWIECGINVCDPLELAAHNDINQYRSQFGRSMAYRGAIDKRCMAAGGQTLADEFERVAPVCRDGGYIPMCDHGIPHDVSWENYIDYGRRLARLTGWM